MNEVEKMFKDYFDATGENLPLQELSGLSEEEQDRLIQEAIKKKEPIKFNEDVVY